MSVLELLPNHFPNMIRVGMAGALTIFDPWTHGVLWKLVHIFVTKTRERIIHQQQGLEFTRQAPGRRKLNTPVVVFGWLVFFWKSPGLGFWEKLGGSENRNFNEGDNLIYFFGGEFCWFWLVGNDVTPNSVDNSFTQSKWRLVLEDFPLLNYIAKTGALVLISHQKNIERLVKVPGDLQRLGT